MTVRRVPSVIPRMRTTAHPEVGTCRIVVRGPRPAGSTLKARIHGCGYRVIVLATRLLVATTVLSVLGLLGSEGSSTQAAQLREDLVATYDTNLHLRWATR